MERIVHPKVEPISKEKVGKFNSSSIITAFPLQARETNVVSIVETLLGII